MTRRHKENAMLKGIKIQGIVSIIPFMEVALSYRVVFPTRGHPFDLPPGGTWTHLELLQV